MGLCSPRTGGHMGGSARRAVQLRPRGGGGSDGSGLLRSGSAHCAGRASPARPLQAKRGGNPRRRPPVLPSAPLPPERALGERGATPSGQGPLQRPSNGTRFAWCLRPGGPRGRFRSSQLNCERQVCLRGSSHPGQLSDPSIPRGWAQQAEGCPLGMFLLP